MPAKYGARPFQEAIDYFEQKLPLPTNGWEDVYAAQHDHAFMVSGANKTAIVEDFATAIRKAINDGETIEDFRKRFDQIVKTHGWDYKGSRGWRSRVIYETNVRQAYNAGREAQMADPEFKRQFPYMEYRHSGAENARPEHKSWDRMVLRSDDPWWDTHSPSNGYGCKCKKFPKSERAMRRMGKDGPDQAPAIEYEDYTDKRTGEVKAVPKGISPGFEYRPGSASMEALTPKLDEAPRHPIPMGRPDELPLPEPTKVSASKVLEDGLADETYLDAFLSEFEMSQGETKVFKDVMGEPLLISDRLFRDASGNLKITKDKIRHRYMALLAQAIIEPDEVWVLLEPDNQRQGKFRLARRYLKRWTLEESGQAVHGFSVFEYSRDNWFGRTVFTPHGKRGKERIPEKDRYMEDQREGVRVYRRSRNE